MDAVFITNTRGLDPTSNQDDRKLVYRDFYNWDKSTFQPPEIYSWQDINLVYDGFNVNCRIMVIGSSASDIVSKDGKVDTTKVRKAKKQIETTVEAAGKLGARVICFGASTKRIAEHSVYHSKMPNNITYSDGDTLTASFAIKEIENNAKKCGIDLNSTQTKIAIIGAYGIIGGALSEYFSQKYSCNLKLVGPNPERLKTLYDSLNFKANIELLKDVSEIKENLHLVVTATNHPNSLLTKKLLMSWGVPIVCDIAQPRNISRKTCKDLRNELIAWEACILENPNMKYTRPYGMGLDINGTKGKIRALLKIQSHRAFACVVETMVLAMAQLLDPEEIKEKNFLGKINLKNIEPLMRLAEKYGFRSREAESYGEKIIQSRFQCFAEKINIKHNNQKPQKITLLNENEA